ncbi:MAG: class IV adenylate cyclase [Candidatus Bathyarchaeia archaeon]|jgi:predicted adenylyl cyclase CyaB
MKETEVKILEINRKKIEQTLIEKGAKKVFDGDIQTLFFDFKDGRIVKSKDVLRLRKEEDKIELTYKKVRFTQTTKTAEEYSVEVSNLEAVKKILENLGLSVTESMEKHRISYTLNHARFDIDRYFGIYDFIPEFMEIEAENTAAIYKYAALLGFKKEDCLPWSTVELIQHYSRSKGKNGN